MDSVNVRCPCAVVSEVPVISTVQFTGGDSVGGLQTLEVSVRTAGAVSGISSGTTVSGTAVLQSITIVETGSQKAALGITFFSANPSASTVTNNEALVINAADIAKVIGYVPIFTTDYVTVSTVSVVSKTVGIILPAGVDQTSIFAAVVTTGTPTYSAANSLRFNYGFLQN